MSPPFFTRRVCRLGLPLLKPDTTRCFAAWDGGSGHPAARTGSIFMKFFPYNTENNDMPQFVIPQRRMTNCGINDKLPGVYLLQFGAGLK
jgi:hypothetical protein